MEQLPEGRPLERPGELDEARVAVDGRGRLAVTAAGRHCAHGAGVTNALELPAVAAAREQADLRRAFRTVVRPAGQVPLYSVLKGTGLVQRRRAHVLEGDPQVFQAV